MRKYWEGETPKTAETESYIFQYYQRAQRLRVIMKPRETPKKTLPERGFTVNLIHLRLQPVEKRREIADLLNDIVMALE